MSDYQRQHCQAHVDKAKHNEKHLNDVLKQVSLYPDWVVAVAFYVAVHYVEAYFTSTGLPEDQRHNVRNQVLSASSDSRLRKIRGRYMALYNRSRFARYFPTSHARIRPDEAKRFAGDACVFIPKSLGY